MPSAAFLLIMGKDGGTNQKTEEKLPTSLFAPGRARSFGAPKLVLTYYKATKFSRTLLCQPIKVEQPSTCITDGSTCREGTEESVIVRFWFLRKVFFNFDRQERDGTCSTFWAVAKAALSIGIVSRFISVVPAMKATIDCGV